MFAADKSSEGCCAKRLALLLHGRERQTVQKPAWLAVSFGGVLPSWEKLLSHSMEPKM